MKKVTMGLLSVVLLFSVASSALAAPSVSSQGNISAMRAECPSAGAVQPIEVGVKWLIPTKGASYSIASTENIEIVNGRYVLAHERGNADVKVFDKNDRCIARYYIAASN
ncbi:hypothetical protein [Paenibacillus popilliae]|uniref:Uncharacterized protein n=1 Tax=Paenibacillus popilliae TaxID=78057 RepID=A0ABY3AN10_PAEPP|nr:hypothetical protein [Paenibacillus sp. SDF0028]TQR44189.1 hypothetical protein C7Y44_13595 [Paenibacillus sp. SDF0028]